MNRTRDLGKVRYKTPVPSDKSDECIGFLQGGRHWEITNRLDLFVQWMQTVGINRMPEVFDLALEKETLGRVQAESVSVKRFEDIADVDKMLVERTAEHDDIVEIY